jgi:DUF4097 and DUF4098 domain-containing protein YvlB
MSDEKLRILKMIQDGTLTPEEGLEIISALEESAKPLGPIARTRTYEIKPMEVCCADSDNTKIVVTQRARTEEETTPPSGQPDADKDRSSKKPRWLHIKVDDPESGKNVNVRIPIALAKTAGRFIPKHVKSHMHEDGVDLDIQALLESLEADGPNNLIEVSEGEKKIVKIYTE